jgi:hypothetical protein
VPPLHATTLQGEAVSRHAPQLPCAETVSSPDLLDDLDQLVETVALAAGEGDEFPSSLDDSAALGRSGHGDTSPAAELEQSLVAKHT